MLQGLNQAYWKCWPNGRYQPIAHSKVLIDSVQVEITEREQFKR
jgi:hypothetical protein